MSTEIRKLTVEDWRLWKTIRLEALQLHPEAFASSFEKEVILSDKEFEDWLIKNDVFAVFTEQSLVGVAGFYVCPGPKARHKGHLFGMYVKKGFRSKGFAHSLAKTVIEHAKQKVEQLHCSVATDNASAKAIYEAVGFKVYGTEPRAMKLGDRYLDEHLMVIDCRP